MAKDDKELIQVLKKLYFACGEEFIITDEIAKKFRPLCRHYTAQEVDGYMDIYFPIYKFKQEFIKIISEE